MDALATHTHVSAGYLGTDSIEDNCIENYYDCFAYIGAVSWLPAFKFLAPLYPTATKSAPYHEAGLCNPENTLLYRSLIWSSNPRLRPMNLTATDAVLAPTSRDAARSSASSVCSARSRSTITP